MSLATLPSLKALQDDPERYNDAYSNGFNLVAKKAEMREQIRQCFDTTIKKQLADVFSSDESFNILGVGVGKGIHELHFLKSLQAHYTSILHVAVEPNADMLHEFKKAVAIANQGASSSPRYHWFEGPLSQFFARRPMTERKFHLISAINSLYFTGDMEATFNQLASMLRENGVMVVVCHTRGHFLQRTFQGLPWLSDHSKVNEQLSSNDIREHAQRMGYDVINIHVPMEMDITDVFDEQSEVGNKIVDFLTQTAYFRQTAPTECIDGLMSLWRSLCIEDHEGRSIAPASEEILVISK